MFGFVLVVIYLRLGCDLIVSRLFSVVVWLCLGYFLVVVWFTRVLLLLCWRGRGQNGWWWSGLQKLPLRQEVMRRKTDGCEAPKRLSPACAWSACGVRHQHSLRREQYFKKLWRSVSLIRVLVTQDRGCGWEII